MVTGYEALLALPHLPLPTSLPVRPRAHVAAGVREQPTDAHVALVSRVHQPERPRAEGTVALSAHVSNLPETPSLLSATDSTCAWFFVVAEIFPDPEPTNVSLQTCLLPDLYGACIVYSTPRSPPRDQTHQGRLTRAPPAPLSWALFPAFSVFHKGPGRPAAGAGTQASGSGKEGGVDRRRR